MSRRRLPNRRASETYSFTWQGMAFTATVSRFSDGTLGEIFLSNGKIDSSADAIARDSAVIFSIALQSGADIDVMRKALLRDARGVPSGPLGTVLDLICGDKK